MTDDGERAVVRRTFDGWAGWIGDFLAVRSRCAWSAQRHLRKQLRTGAHVEISSGNDGLDQIAACVRADRAAAAQLERRVYDMTRQALTHPGMAGISDRDAGLLLDICHQRVAQIRSSIPPCEVAASPQRRNRR